MIQATRDPAPDRLPWKRLPLGPDGEVVIRARKSLSEMRSRIAPWAEMFSSTKLIAEEFSKAVQAEDIHLARAFKAQDVALSARFEAYYAGMLMLAWADHRWDLETRKRYEALEFANDDEPLEAAGRALIEELMDAGWDAEDIQSAGAGVINEYFIGLKALPPAAEVEKAIEVFPPTAETLIL